MDGRIRHRRLIAVSWIHPLTSCAPAQIGKERERGITGHVPSCGAAPDNDLGRNMYLSGRDVSTVSLRTARKGHHAFHHTGAQEPRRRIRLGDTSVRPIFSDRGNWIILLILPEMCTGLAHATRTYCSFLHLSVCLLYCVSYRPRPVLGRPT